MRRCMAVCAGLLLGISSVCAQALSESPLKVLVLTGGHDFNRPAFAALFDGVKGIEWKEAVYGGKELNATEILASDAWKAYDVFVFYDMVQGLPEKSLQGLAALPRAGKGLLFLHHTIAANQTWPEYRKMLGGKFFTAPTKEDGKEYGTSGYQHDRDMTVTACDPTHPITYGLTTFKIHDESYNKYVVAPGVTPLLVTDDPTSDKVIGWTHGYEQSRVVYLQLGHDEKAYENPAFKLLVERSIRYTAARPAAADLPWQSLLDGKSLAGWRAEGGAKWQVADGMLVGEQGPNNAAGDLYSTASFGDFEAVVNWRVRWPANSGIWFRFQNGSKSYQADILEFPNPRCFAGTIYCGPKMFLSMNEDPALVKKDGWNTFVIRAAGRHLVVFLNGKKVGDVLDDVSAEGVFGVQVHAGTEFGTMRIEIKEFKVRKI
jgi:uncharacterized protein